jgi:tRNA-Thr(GGU) m(6)t(6)A37 methyltransferase TsaA
MYNQTLTIVAKIHTQFSQKFGIPRQSGLVNSLLGEIHFEGEFRNPDVVRGIEEFSHLWLLWGFSKIQQNTFSMTVAPPRLGGNVRKGVFATRSPYRPNSIGLSSVKLERVEYRNNGEPVLIVSGADILDGTPIYDIKPYLPYTDCHNDANGGFTDTFKQKVIDVDFPQNLKLKLPEKIRQTVSDVLAQDPRAAYNKKPDYVYGMNFADFDIRFTVNDNVLYVIDVTENTASNVK